MSKIPLHFVIFFNFYYKMKYYFLYLKIKGLNMSVIIKNAESLFERFESKMEIWAEKLF